MTAMFAQLNAGIAHNRSSILKIATKREQNNMGCLMSDTRKSSLSDVMRQVVMKRPTCRLITIIRAAQGVNPAENASEERFANDTIFILDILRTTICLQYGY
jgi:hypothetical protein